LYSIKLTPIAVTALQKLDKKTRKQIWNKILDLKNEPLKRGKQLTAALSEFRSIRAAGQRYRIIYKVIEDKVLVIIIAVGIRKARDKRDIYNLLKKYINQGLID
jgi:mRNA interferase RelE/StbE